MQLEGKVAAVTGGTRGIGLGIAKAFLDQGASVAVNGRSADKGQQALDRLAAGDRAAFFAGDVTKQADTEGFVDQTIARFGRIDILVNNAGGGGELLPCVEMSDESWNLVIDWNLNSTFWATRRALKAMIPHQWGRIINVSSVEGKQGKPVLSAYCAAKHGINGFTKAVAQEVGTLGITVNSLCPGLVLTDIVLENGPSTAEAMGISFEEMVAMYTQESAIKRTITIEEVAAMAVLLASDAGSGITGAMLSIDGGTAGY